MLAVYVEQTGAIEDKQIREYHRELRVSGMIFNPETSAKYGPLSQSDLGSTLLLNPNFFTKSHPIGQLADLLLYPLIKGKYDPTYRPFEAMKCCGKIIDSNLARQDATLGVKYYCFDA